MSGAIRSARPIAPEPDLWHWEAARRRCFAEAMRILRNRDDAEEAVQEALVRGWRKRHTCRTPRAPLPWLLKITRNEATRLAARRSRRYSSEVPDPEPEAVPARDEADASIEQTLNSLATAQALRALRPEERRLLKLRYEQDLTQGQVAAALGLTEGNVKVRLHRARARLRGVASDLNA